jgi:hypothetical protein
MPLRHWLRMPNGAAICLVIALLSTAMAAHTLARSAAQPLPNPSSVHETNDRTDPGQKPGADATAAAGATDAPAGAAEPSSTPAPAPQAGDLSTKPASPPAARSIADALCGRSSPQHQSLASALDNWDSRRLRGGWPWESQSVGSVGAWRKEKECVKATALERARFAERRDALLRLERRLARADAIAGVTRPLLTPAPEAIESEWPSTCGPCRELQRLIDDVLAIVRPIGSKLGAVPERIGDRLRWMDAVEPVARNVCAARGQLQEPAAATRERFAYFTWTPTGARMLRFAQSLTADAMTAMCP